MFSLCGLLRILSQLVIWNLAYKKLQLVVGIWIEKEKEIEKPHKFYWNLDDLLYSIETCTIIKYMRIIQNHYNRKQQNIYFELIQKLNYFSKEKQEEKR
jgi:hypothetical protein